MNITDAKTIKLTWIYQGDYYLYETVPGSLTANENQNSIRFTLRELEDKEPDFETVIQGTEGQYVFKADCFRETDEYSPLKRFAAEDALVLYFEDDFGHGFFQLEA